VEEKEIAIDMKSCENLDEMVNYLLKKHRELRGPKGNVTSYKLLRKPSGKRIMFEETRGFKIIKFDVQNENSIIINQLCSGYAFKGQHKRVLTSNLYLHDLVVVNAYDHKAEFFSLSSIDFVYIECNPSISIQTLQDWVDNNHGIIRAQWVHKDEYLEQLLDEISIGRRVTVDQPRTRRHIDMNCENI